MVDGPYDGGIDLEVIVDGNEIRKNIQLTVQKNNIEDKILEDAEKSRKNVDEYNYLRVLDFYCSKKD